VEYRLADKTAKEMSDKEILELLNLPKILRIALVDERDRMPLVHPVWYYYENEKFYISTDSGGAKARSLRKNPDVYFLVDIDPDKGQPYGVRGKGKARVIDDPELATKVTVRNVLRYLGSLDGQVAQSLIEMGKDSSVIEITPQYIASWKY